MGKPPALIVRTLSVRLFKALSSISGVEDGSHNFLRLIQLAFTSVK